MDTEEKQAEAREIAQAVTEPLPPPEEEQTQYNIIPLSARIGSFRLAVLLPVDEPLPEIATEELTRQVVGSIAQQMSNEMALLVAKEILKAVRTAPLTCGVNTKDFKLVGAWNAGVEAAMHALNSIVKQMMSPAINEQRAQAARALAAQRAEATPEVAQ